MSEKIDKNTQLGLDLISRGVAKSLGIVRQDVQSVGFEAPNVVQINLKSNYDQKRPFKFSAERDKEFAFWRLRYQLQHYDSSLDIVAADKDGSLRVYYSAKPIAYVGYGLPMGEKASHYFVKFSKDIFNLELLDTLVDDIGTYIKSMEYVLDEDAGKEDNNGKN